jgi:ribonuclease HI
VFEYCYFLVVDGGALNQGSADIAGYGSFCLEARTGQKQTIRLDFGRGVTNNEAEYRTLIAGLKDLVGRIQRAGKFPSTHSLLVHTDSQLMIGQLAHPATLAGLKTCRKERVYHNRREPQNGSGSAFATLTRFLSHSAPENRRETPLLAQRSTMTTWDTILVSLRVPSQQNGVPSGQSSVPFGILSRLHVMSLLDYDAQSEWIVSLLSVVSR